MDGLLGRFVREFLHRTVHGGQRHLTLKVHLHRAVLYSGVVEIILGISQLEKREWTPSLASLENMKR